MKFMGKTVNLENMLDDNVFTHYLHYHGKLIRYAVFHDHTIQYRTLMLVRIHAHVPVSRIEFTANRVCTGQSPDSERARDQW